MMGPGEVTVVGFECVCFCRSDLRDIHMGPVSKFMYLQKLESSSQILSKET